MAEIYINTNSPITHRVFWQGEIVAADAVPTVKVYDVTSDITITPAILPTTLLTTLTSTAAETDTGGGEQPQTPTGDGNERAKTQKGKEITIQLG